MVHLVGFQRIRTGKIVVVASETQTSTGVVKVVLGDGADPSLSDYAFEQNYLVTRTTCYCLEQVNQCAERLFQLSRVIDAERCLPMGNGSVCGLNLGVPQDAVVKVSVLIVEIPVETT